MCVLRVKALNQICFFFLHSSGCFTAKNNHSFFFWARCQIKQVNTHIHIFVILVYKFWIMFLRFHLFGHDKSFRFSTYFITFSFLVHMFLSCCVLFDIFVRSNIHTHIWSVRGGQIGMVEQIFR